MTMRYCRRIYTATTNREGSETVWNVQLIDSGSQLARRAHRRMHRLLYSKSCNVSVGVNGNTAYRIDY